MNRGRTDLGTSYTNFRPSVDMHTAVRLARNSRTHSVHDTDAECSSLKAVFQCEDSISRLTRLGEEHANIITEDGRFAIQKVARKLDAHRNLSELLKDRARGDT